MGKLGKKIIIRLDGGLGNQLFQWAFGLKLALLNNAQIYFDTQLNKKAQSKLFLRPILLEKVGIPLSKLELKSNLFNNLFVNPLLIDPKIEIIEKPISFMPESIKTYKERTIVTQGYWQSEAYFKDIEQEIRNSIKIVRSNRGNVQTVGIHVRRGDYISDIENARIYYDLSQTDYYDLAINYIMNKVEKPIFYVFSDDLEWCKYYFKKFNVFCLSHNDIVQDFISLANCNHQIIANSTFSWWAAWLNSNPSKLVVTPKKWYKNHWTSDYINPPEWIVL